MKKTFVALFAFLISMEGFAQVDSMKSDTLEEVKITAKYLSPVSIAGELMPIRQIPQSVSVVNTERIKEMNITTIDQAMQQVTGVTTISNDNMRSQYKSRGYSMSIMTDGLPAYNSLAVSQQFDLSFFEQIEVLRGVSGILQGVPDGQSLGGVINLV
ncbi:MAG: TonB-dependent receptor plug domain-containing protein, partial [Bacteroidales bacterium]|nr:TonB-dependent receptor plug domain-containing protein [Bacteroidales bacterium]